MTFSDFHSLFSVGAPPAGVKGVEVGDGGGGAGWGWGGGMGVGDDDGGVE